MTTVEHISSSFYAENSTDELSARELLDLAIYEEELAHEIKANLDNPEGLTDGCRLELKDSLHSVLGNRTMLLGKLLHKGYLPERDDNGRISGFTENN